MIANLSRNSQQPFRLLDLPPELQYQIYERYFDGAPHASLRKYHPSKISLQLERACRQMCQDVRLVREKVWTRVLEVNTGELQRLSEAPIFLQKRIEEIRILGFDSLRRSGLSFPILQLYRILRNGYPRLRFIRIAQEVTGAIPEEICYGGNSISEVAQHLLDNNDSEERHLLQHQATRRLREMLKKRWGNDFCIQIHQSTKMPSPSHWKDPRYLYKAISYTFEADHERLDKWLTHPDMGAQRTWRENGVNFPELWRDYLFQKSGRYGIPGDRLCWMDGFPLRVAPSD